VFEALARWRKATAARDGVPAYVVFSDAALRAIATARPVDLEGLGRCWGVGVMKLEHYGDDLLGVIDAVGADLP
jgi:ATP-dependent DNA helicase RecQ